MRRALIRFHDKSAGILFEEAQNRSYRFAYLPDYQGPGISLTMPVRRELSYIIRRFDRTRQGKLPLEDGAQLAGKHRQTKYNYSMEKLVTLLQEHCTFPQVELSKLFKLILFS